MGWVDEVATRPVAEVTAALGWGGSDRKGWPCPACRETSRGSSDKRGPVGTTRGGRGWRCHRCDAHGDALDYVALVLGMPRLRECTREQRRAIRTWCAEQGWTLTPTSPYQVVPGWTPRPREETRPAAVRPPRAQVDALWRMSTRTDADLDVVEWMEGRGLDPRVVADHDLARVTPSRLPRWPAWWPGGRARTWRVVVRAWDRLGEPVSLHARAVGQPPEVNGRRLPKTLWPKGMDSGGLLFADAAGVRLLRGAAEGLWGLVVAEGLTDWLALAAYAATRPPGVAVVGGTSGGWSALQGVRLPDGCDVVVAVDEDAAGDRYAVEICTALRRTEVRRLRPSDLTRRAA